MLTEKDYYFQLASRLKLEMSSLGLTIRELAEEAHVSDVTVARVLSGNARPNAYTAYKLTETLSRIRGMRHVHGQEAKS